MHSAGQTYTQQTKEKQTMYIKTYKEHNSETYLLKNIGEEIITATTHWIDIDHLAYELDGYNAITPDNKIKGLDRIIKEEIIKTAFPDEGSIIGNIETFEDFSHYSEPVLDNQGDEPSNAVQGVNKKMYQVVKYIDHEGDNCFILPTGPTYLINEKGSTISKIV